VIHSSPADTRDAAPPYIGLTIGLALFGFLALVAFWVIWFFVDRSWLASQDTVPYYVFENAFPAADAWLAACCGLGAWALYKRKAIALLWLLTGGSASLYLGLMDVLFDVQNGIYAAHGNVGAVVTEVAINVSTFGIGAWSLYFGWQHRRWFIARA
jgi:hypothetical protein